MNTVSFTGAGASELAKYQDGEKFPISEKLRQEIIASDIRTASIHEAGHIVAALNIGIPIAKGHIYKRNDGDVWGVKAIGGRMWTLQGRRKLQDAVIGYAGVVAELLADDMDKDVWDILDHIEGQDVEPSDTDWNCIRKIHESWQKRALARCIEILKANWRRVERVAAELVRNLEWHAEIVADDDGHDSACYFTAETLEASK